MSVFIPEQLQQLHFHIILKFTFRNRKHFIAKGDCLRPHQITNHTLQNTAQSNWSESLMAMQINVDV